MERNIGSVSGHRASVWRGAFIQTAQAASKKEIKTVTVKIGSKKVNGKTFSMKRGKTASIKVSTSPKLAGKTVTYKSSKPSVVTVSKKGKLTAKKAGTATIRVTVQTEGYKSQKVTFQVKVAKNTAQDQTETNTGNGTGATGNDEAGSSSTENSSTGDSSAGGSSMGGSTKGETSSESQDGTAGNTPAKKTLVVYFSATNTTKGVAETIAEAAGAELYEIQPADPYTAADLDYSNDSCRANTEQQNSSARPAIEGSIESFGDYEVLYLGFPIWWGEEPRIIDTFLESYDFSGKTIVPFCTSGGSGISTAVSNIKDIVSGSPEVKSGRRFQSGVSKATVEEWIEGLKLE